MKIIIVGCGKVGATLAEQLSNEGNDIVIVDKVVLSTIIVDIFRKDPDLICIFNMNNCFCYGIYCGFDDQFY